LCLSIFYTRGTQARYIETLMYIHAGGNRMKPEKHLKSTIIIKKQQ
jgi:hypothetical protein